MRALSGSKELPVSLNPFRYTAHRAGPTFSLSTKGECTEEHNLCQSGRIQNRPISYLARVDEILSKRANPVLCLYLGLCSKTYYPQCYLVFPDSVISIVHVKEGQGRLASYFCLFHLTALNKPCSFERAVVDISWL